MKCAQKSFRLPSMGRGCHLVTSDIQKQIAPMLAGLECGMLNVFLQHTSASLTINENCDPDVRVDMETFLRRVVPEGHGSSVPWTHTAEGPDDMPVSAPPSDRARALRT